MIFLIRFGHSVMQTKWPAILEIAGFPYAPQVGLEPTTLRLTGQGLYNVQALEYKDLDCVRIILHYRFHYETAFF